MIRVKICGVTRLEDAIAVSELGADAIGLVFYPASKRNIAITQAQKIARQLPPFITKVALFCDASEPFIRSVLAQVFIDCIQFHGRESHLECQKYNKPYIKAVRVKENEDTSGIINQYPTATAILLDSFSAVNAGGTGIPFNWNLIPQYMHQPLIIAGGINATNVSALFNIIHPYAIDLSSGVEKEPGIKDYNKIQNLVKAVKNGR